MTTAAVICELNPFHRGHAYLFRKAREAGADRVIALMSGDYVQRGEPALISHTVRAEMALGVSSGAEENDGGGHADLVLQMPVWVSTSSAEEYAAGAVEILNRLGCIDFLAFGSESGDLGALGACARTLLAETESFRAALSLGLKHGLSYPAARAAALPEYTDLLRTPNNILAVEYLKALSRSGSRIIPITFRRIGGGYHDLFPDTSVPSASAIRRTALAGPESGEYPGMPAHASWLFAREMRIGACVRLNDFSSILAERLFAAEVPGQYAEYRDVSPEIASTFFHGRESFRDIESFVGRCASRSVTESRIRRAALHMILRERKDTEQALFVRLLGFRSEAGELPGRIAQCAAVPMITNPARLPGGETEEVKEAVRREIAAANLYEWFRAGRSGRAFRNPCRERVIRV